jgi:hypothetical protein
MPRDLLFDQTSSENALTYLDKLYDRYNTLEEIPANDNIIYSVKTLQSLKTFVSAPAPELCVTRESITDKASQTDEDDWKYLKTKAALFEYGWPDNFRREDWMRDIPELHEKWYKEKRAARLAKKDEQALRGVQDLDVGDDGEERDEEDGDVDGDGDEEG